jgi:hypothetical protein
VPEKRFTSNRGIINEQGTIISQSLAVGDNANATTYNISRSAEHDDLARVLSDLAEAIRQSAHLNSDEKKQYVEVVACVEEEIAEPTPNKPLLKILTDGLLTSLKAVPDVAKALTALSPVLAKFL